MSQLVADSAVSNPGTGLQGRVRSRPGRAPGQGREPVAAVPVRGPVGPRGGPPRVALGTSGAALSRPMSCVVEQSGDARVPFRPRGVVRSELTDRGLAVIMVLGALLLVLALSAVGARAIAVTADAPAVPVAASRG